MARRNPQRGVAQPIARVQQPTDSHAASLPTETLVQILNSSLEGMDSWEKQKARLSFAQVCVGWYGAVDLGRELAVENTTMAERCARSLAQKTVEQRSKIRSLSIEIEDNGAGRGQRAASLVKVCPRLEKVELLGIGRNLGTAGHLLGAPLAQALKGLANTRSFRISNSSRRMRIAGGDLMDIISGWPKLTNLHLRDVIPYSRVSFDAPTAQLAELHLPLMGGRSTGAFVAFFTSGRTTLRHLDLGQFPTTMDALAEITGDVKTLLETIAPQLVTLQAVFDFGAWGLGVYAASDALISTLTALRDVESLSLGVLGFSFSTILPLLQSLVHLHTLSIGQSALQATVAPFDQFTAAATLDFIAEAPAIKALTLPRQVKARWTKDDLERVEAAAVEKDVRFVLG